jgi:hypothetical protein
MRTIFVALILGLIGATGAVLATHAAEVPYKDDRSSAVAVVNSFYNAINLGQYARAYGYFGKGPQAYPDFKAGYAKTKSVKLLTGKAQAEGAAGSVYYSLPVAIDAVDTAGKHSQFAGCYQVRLVQPGIQEPPFNPLHIETASLKPAKGKLEAILPKTCR